jgi:hypothetical protein
MTLFIGMFPLIGIATAVGLMPSFFMDWFDRVTSRIKIMVAHSFAGISSLIQRLIPPQREVIIPEWLRNIRTGILIFLLIFVFDWNFSNLTFIKSKLSDGLRPIGYALRLDQNWGMFAPGVFKDDGWYILEGVTDKDEHLNVFSEGKPVDTRKPENVVSLFKNDRWRKYTENMILTYHSFMRGYFCNYYKRIWNESHTGRKIKALRIIYMSEFTLPDYQYSKPDPEILWECED